MINTIIVNAQKEDRDKITTLLSSQGNIKVMAYGKDGYDALKLVGSLKPDIAILDNHLDFIEGEELSPLLKARSATTAVVILISKISDNQLYRAIANDVSGFVSRDAEMDMLPGILKSISEGGCFISPLLAARVLHLLSASDRKGLDTHNVARRPPVKKPVRETGERKFPSREDPMVYLSKTELRILTSVGEGYTSEEIAKKLGLAIGTVRNYISSVMRKTGQHNRSQIARYAFYYGLVPLAKP